MKIFQVDAFTSRMFAGNPAGVCIFMTNETDEWMQDMASEMNLSETAFLKKRDDGYDLRWFTPNREVDLCGHATLAAAHVLYETGTETGEMDIKFYTRSGSLSAKKIGNWIELNFPSEEDEAVPDVPEIIRGINARHLYLGKNRMDYIIEVESETILRELEPDIGILKKVGTRGFIVTSRSDDKKIDFVSRFFAPAFAVDEDPVTGSAHCCLGPYWKRKLGKNEFVAYQASKRGGLLKVRVKGDRVHLSGEAVTVFSGEVAN